MTQLIPGVPVPEGEFQTIPAPTQQPDGTLERGSRLLGDETVSFSNWTWRAALDWDLMNGVEVATEWLVTDATRL